MSINREDYEEARCLLCMEEPGKEKAEPVDMRRIMAKLDEYLDKEAWDEAERLLSYWLNEAEHSGDKRGQFSIHNEIMGLKRKLGKEQEALEASSAALKLGEELGIMDTVGGATAYVNSATVLEAFARPEEAAELYKKALPVYEASLSDSSAKLGSLYNNMAIALSACGEYDEAFSYYDKALDIMSRVDGGKIEQALSFLNMADSFLAMHGLENGIEKIEDCLAKAQVLLDSEELRRDGYYAYMAGKCVDSFRYFGYFAYAKELEERVKDIYDRLRAG